MIEILLKSILAGSLSETVQPASAPHPASGQQDAATARDRRLHRPRSLRPGRHPSAGIPHRRITGRGTTIFNNKTKLNQINFHQFIKIKFN